MTPEEKQKLKQQLIEIYEGYVKDKNNSEIKAKAQKLFFDYIYMKNILDREFLSAVHGLEHIGWEFSRELRTNIEWKMKEDEAKEILGKLKI